MTRGVEIFDQTLRDGLMNRPEISSKIKGEYLNRMTNCGMKHFEIVRFPIDGQYPQFNRSLELLETAQKLRDKATIASFAMGEQGIEEALRHSHYFDQLHIPCFVSDEYSNYAFGKRTWNDSMNIVRSTYLECSRVGVELTVGLGTSFGCPISQTYDAKMTVAKVKELFSTGIDCVMLGDTAGTATPAMVRLTIESLREFIASKTLRVHFHNTFGRALLNTWTACMSGIGGIDTSLMGLGGEGHPYFFDANAVNNGNCATEEIISLLERTELPSGRLDTQGMSKELFSICRWFALQLHNQSLLVGRSSYAEFVTIKEVNDEISQAANRH